MKMNRLILRGSLLAVALGTALNAGAAEVRWVAAQTHDLSTDALVRSALDAPLSAGANRNTELVEFQWNLSSKDSIASLDSGSTNTSKQYWLDVSAAELSRGISIHTTSRNALVRISPLEADNGIELSRDQINLTQQGTKLDTNASLNHFVTAEQLRASGAPFAEGTVAFRLNNNVAPGTLKLAVANAAAGDTHYVVHVFEPDSTHEAALKSTQAAHLSGDIIEATLNIPGASGEVRGFLISPDGKTSIPLDFNHDKAGYHTSVQAPRAQSTGLWELQTFFNGRTSSGQTILRDTKTAISITAPTARLTQTVELKDSAPALGTKTSNQWSVQLGVEVAAAGRYQLSGVLYGTAKDGTQQPVMMAQSAQWLEPGQHSLPLSFTANTLSKGDIGAPYEVRDLRLLDQSRLGVLHRQEHALTINR